MGDKITIFVNHRTNEYIRFEANTEIAIGRDWRQLFSLTAAEEVFDAQVYQLPQEDHALGIPFDYFLREGGAHFLLLSDAEEHSAELIRKAKRHLRQSRDVTGFTVCRLKRWNPVDNLDKKKTAEYRSRGREQTSEEAEPCPISTH